MLMIRDLTVARGEGPTRFTVCLPTLQLERGQVVVIKGQSGCGKSTLLELIGLILRPDTVTDYRLQCDDVAIDIADLIKRGQGNQLAYLRARHFGFMLQTGGLLPFLTVKANLYLPNQLLQRAVEPDRFNRLTEQLGVAHLLNKYPQQLSIGERQRVAFIRAIMPKPTVLLADEPTSALDPDNADRLFELILSLTQQEQISALIVTHDWQRVAQQKLQTLTAQLDTKSQSLFKLTARGGMHD